MDTQRSWDPFTSKEWVIHEVLGRVDRFGRFGSGRQTHLCCPYHYRKLSLGPREKTFSDLAELT